MNYQTKKDKSKEFLNYFLGGSPEPTESQKNTVNEQKTASCEQKAPSHEQNTPDCEQTRNKAEQMPIVKTYASDRQFSREEGLSSSADIPDIPVVKTNPVIPYLQLIKEKYYRNYQEGCILIGQDVIANEEPSPEVAAQAKKDMAKWELMVEIIEEQGVKNA